MAKNLLKRNQVVSVDDHQNKTDVKKRKVKEVHQKSLTCGPVGRNFKVNNIVRLCKKKHLQNVTKINVFPEQVIISFKCY